MNNDISATKCIALNIIFHEEKGGGGHFQNSAKQIKNCAEQIAENKDFKLFIVFEEGESWKGLQRKGRGR